MAPTAIRAWARRLSRPQSQSLGARRNPRTGRFVAASLKTIRLVLAEIDIERLERDVDAWPQDQGNAREPCEHLGMDGKCLKGSYDHDRQNDGTRTAKGSQHQITIVGIATPAPASIPSRTTPPDYAPHDLGILLDANREPASGHRKSSRSRGSHHRSRSMDRERILGTCHCLTLRNRASW